jgi:hypothetical protein
MTTTEAFTVNKEIAINAKHGQMFYHKSLRQGPKNARIALRVRVTGKCQTWKRSPNDFRLPIKFGLRESWAITHENCHDWFTSDPTSDALPLKSAHADHLRTSCKIIADYLKEGIVRNMRPRYRVVNQMSKAKRKRFNKRDRRKAKQSNWKRAGRSNPKKVGHGGGGQR